LQYTIGILHQQEQRLDQPPNHGQQHPNTNPPPPPPLNYNIPTPLPSNYNIPPSNYHIPYHQPPHNQYIPPPPQFGTIYHKSPLASHLQLAPWLPHYQATPPPKYRGNADPHKFLMSYETTIASTRGDEATLAKSLIISLEDAIVNWYSRLLPGCIYSWLQLKEKFLLNF
jgi:hypothetical protein